MVFPMRLATAGLLASSAQAITDMSWSDARAKADALVSQMTSLEKENVTQGQGVNTCSGQTGSVDRLKIPGFCLQDAGSGVRQTDFVNAYSSGISVAASFNVELARARGSYMGAEFKRKGNHAINGPVVGPLGRMAKDGRLFEAFGSDRECSLASPAQSNISQHIYLADLSVQQLKVFKKVSCLL
ncbi:hypothetical protein MRB53_042299 [Persea americana]|nr:hypothetical protein MRB53_042299 [Persea americana]